MHRQCTFATRAANDVSQQAAHGCELMHVDRAVAVDVDSSEEREQLLLPERHRMVVRHVALHCVRELREVEPAGAVLVIPIP